MLRPKGASFRSTPSAAGYADTAFPAVRDGGGNRGSRTPATRLALDTHLASRLPYATAGMDSARLFNRIAQGNVANIAFNDFARLLSHLGFVRRRIAGSHHIYGHPLVPELVNVQDVAGVAKPYQVKQVWRLVRRYNLKLEDGQ